MQLVNSSLNDLSSNAAVTLRAITDRGNLIVFLSGSWHSHEKPLVSVVCNPSVLAVHRSNPDTGLFSAVNNQQRPLSFEAIDLGVTNGYRVEGVDHDKVIFSQHQLGSEPEANCGYGNEQSHYDVADWVFVSNRVKQKLSRKQGIEGKSANSPDPVAFGTENLDFVHFPIIALQNVNKEGTQK